MMNINIQLFGGRGGSSGGGGGGGVSVSKAYSDIMNNNATINSLANLKSQMGIDKAKFSVNGNSVKCRT